MASSDILEFTEYAIDKLKDINTSNRDELLEFIHKLFFDNDIEFRKNVIYYSGFEGDHGEEVPITHTIKNLTTEDKLKLCDAIICNSTEALNNQSNNLYEHFDKKYPSSRCSNAWQGDHMAYRCRTCGLSDSSCMCVECFDPEEHEGHDFRLYSSPSGGCCDCGDPLAWKTSGFCKRHQVPDDYYDPSSMLDETTRFRVEAVVHTVLQFLLVEAGKDVHPKILTKDTFAEYIIYLGENAYRKFENDYILLTLWLKKIADCCDAFRHIICEFYLGVRIPCVQKDELINSFSLQTEEYLEKYKLPPVKLCFQISRKMREEPQTQFAMLHLSLLFSSKFKEKYTLHFCSEYADYILLLKESPDPSIGKGVSGFLDRVFCQLFHSPDQVLKLTKTSNLISSLVNIFTRILKDCVTLKVTGNNTNDTHMKAGVAHKCIDAEATILSQEKHCRSRILVDLKTLIGHTIVSKVLVLGLNNNNSLKNNSRGNSGLVTDLRLYKSILEMMSIAQGMNGQRREITVHLTYENKGYKVAFMMELELIQISCTLSSIIQNIPYQNVTDTTISNANNKMIDEILFETKSALCMWLDNNHYSSEHALTYLNRPCPNVLSFHYPLHRTFALVLNAYVQRGRISQMNWLSAGDLLNLLFKSDVVSENANSVTDGDGSRTFTEFKMSNIEQEEREHEILRIIEHPLLVFIFMYQIYSQKWARNGRTMYVQLLYLRNHYWHDYTILADFFLLQFAAAVCSGDKVINILMSRFEVGCGVGKLSSPFLNLNSNLFAPGTSEYTPNLWRKNAHFNRYFPHLRGISVDQLLFDSISLSKQTRWSMPMGEYFLMFIGQLANDRTCVGESKKDTLRRALIHWLAVADMTYSQLEDKISNSLYSKSASASEIGDSKLFQSTLMTVSTFRAPVGIAAGKYTLKDECWREIDLYFLHWTKQDQVKAVTNYNSFYEYKIKEDQNFFKTDTKFPNSPFYPPLQTIKNKYIYPPLTELPRNLLLTPLLHEIFFGVLFNTLIRSKTKSSGSLFAYAVNLIIMSLEIDHVWDGEMAHINEPPISDGFPYASRSMLVNFITKVPIQPNSQYEQTTCGNQLVGHVSMLEIVAFLKDNNDMETSHASLQHIINLVSTHSLLAKVEFARCAGIAVEQVGKDQEDGESQVDNEKAKLRQEANLRQQQIMEDFKKRQEAFFLEEDSEDSGDDSSESSDDNDDDNKSDESENADGETSNGDMVVDSLKDTSNRCRSKSSEEELCALCHDPVNNISKHGYPGMLGFISPTNTFDHLTKQEEVISITVENEGRKNENNGGNDKCSLPKNSYEQFGQLWKKTCGKPYEFSSSTTKSSNVQILGCGHILHLNCYMDYFESLIERQESHQRFEGFNRVTPSHNEFLCPTCRRICNVIIPVATISHKRQHLDKKSKNQDSSINNKNSEDSDNFNENNLIPNTFDKTLSNMKLGLRDNYCHNSIDNTLNGNGEINVENFNEKLKDMNQSILRYNEQDRFLYFYSTYLRKLSSSEYVSSSVANFPKWCNDSLKLHVDINTNYIARQNMERDPEIDNSKLPYPIDFDWIARIATGKDTDYGHSGTATTYIANLSKSTQSFNGFLRFLAARICDKIQLTEVGQRQCSPVFCSFSTISTKEGKTILAYCGSLLRAASLPHLQEAAAEMKQRVNNYTFKNSVDSLLLFDGTKYEPILRCQNPFKVFCHSVVANGISSNSKILNEICRVHFIANYLSCRLRALFTILNVVSSSKGVANTKEIMMIKTHIRTLCRSYKELKGVNEDEAFKSNENATFMELKKMPLQEKSSICNTFHLDFIENLFKNNSDNRNETNNRNPSTVNVKDFFDKMLSELLLYFEGSQGMEGLDSLFVNDGGRLRSIDLHLVKTLSYDQLTHFYCLPFLRQMYIFRYYALDNSGDYGNLTKVDETENLTLEEEYKLHLRSMGLPLFTDEYEKCEAVPVLSKKELQLCAIWMDQLKSNICLTFNNTFNAANPLSIVAKQQLLLPMQLIKLPPLYTTLYMKYYFNKVKCFGCGEIPASPAMCLICGDLVCCGGTCVNRNGIRDSKNQLLTGGCSIHAADCGRGTCVFLLLKECQILICLKGERSCIYSALYLDEHGEEDRELKRGVLLKLEQNRLELLRQMVAKCSFEHESRILSQTYLNWARRYPQF
jgi:hypothetical protein